MKSLHAGCALASTALLLLCAPLVRAADAVPLATFLSSTTSIQVVDFSTAGFGVPASIPGGTPGALYFESISYGPIQLISPSGNSNKPGLAYTSQHPVYMSDYPGALAPGLGAFGNDDGIRINFSAIGGVNAVGAMFGSIQEPTACCVQQWVDIVFEDNTTQRVDLVAVFGFERSRLDFSGILSAEKKMISVEFNQLGHTALIDNITWGNLSTPVPEPSPTLLFLFSLPLLLSAHLLKLRQWKHSPAQPETAAC